jgi:hypothetical protein
VTLLDCAAMRTRLWVLIALSGVLLVPALSACGADDESTSVAEGEPLTLDPLQYNVIISRFLNPDDTEDADFLVGQPPLEGDELYLGVFMQIKNEDEDASAPLPSSFKVVDTQDREYRPIESNSPYALPLGGTVPPDGEYPIPDSTADVGPIEGSLVLFKISTESTEDRPLQLEIPGTTSGESGTVELDI